MTVFVLLWSIVRRTLHDIYCQYSSSQAILKLSQSARGHFVTLIESGVHLITGNPGSFWLLKQLYLFFSLFFVLNFTKDELDPFPAPFSAWTRT